MSLQPGLYIVSTPIGNIGDISIRAVETLKQSDIILCEDTRVSAKLLAKYNITSTLYVYNDKKNHKQIDKFIIKSIGLGKIISLISDAGTPLISDPGYKIVKQIKEMGYFIDVLPGASSPIAALTLSGLPTDRFIFLGFLPKTDIGRVKIFTEFAKVNATLIFLERSTRILKSLNVALKVLGNREANISRELTKLFQESKTANLQILVESCEQNLPKGEIVLLISGKNILLPSEEEVIMEVKKLLTLGKHTKDISDFLFQKYHKVYKKSKIYKICNYLKQMKSKI